MVIDHTTFCDTNRGKLYLKGNVYILNTVVNLKEIEQIYNKFIATPVTP